MNTMTKGFFAIALSATIALAGCSSPDAKGSGDDAQSSKAAATQTRQQAQGESYSGSDYSTTLPAGFKEVKGRGSDTQAYFSRGGDANAVPMVLIASASDDKLTKLTPDQLEKGMPAQLKKSGMKNIKVEPRVTIDGKEHVHLSGTTEDSGTTLLFDELMLIGKKQMDTVTVTSKEKTPAADRKKVYDPIISAWQWK